MWFCDDDGCGVPFVVVLFLILVCRHLLSTGVEQNLQQLRTEGFRLLAEDAKIWSCSYSLGCVRLYRNCDIRKKQFSILVNLFLNMLKYEMIVQHVGTGLKYVCLVL